MKRNATGPDPGRPIRPLRKFHRATAYYARASPAPFAKRWSVFTTLMRGWMRTMLLVTEAEKIKHHKSELQNSNQVNLSHQV